LGLRWTGLMMLGAQMSPVQVPQENNNHYRDSFTAIAWDESDAEEQ
tara:strand:+ start:940 stop:1077 length:138 start_codon:yes stop_codon:yes gene_type:complete